MRVLFTSNSGYGHVHPMVPLALALKVRGHEVRWATPEEACPGLARLGIDAALAGAGMRACLSQYRSRHPEAAALAPEQRSAHVFEHVFGAVAAPVMLEEMLPLAQEWRPHLIVHEAAEFAAPLAATVTGVPSVCHGYGTIIPPERVAAAAAHLEPHWRALGFEPGPFGGCYDHLYLDIVPPALNPDELTHMRPALRGNAP